MKKLLDLRPCDNCDGPVGLQFYVVRFSLALVNRQAVNEFLGMHQFFGGRSVQLAEMFAPHASDAIKVAGDVDPALMTELVICRDCYMDKPLDLPLLSEKLNARQKRDDGAARADGTADI